MKNEEIRKSNLNETELEQISGGDQPLILVQPDPRLRTECPQCSYIRYIFSKSDLIYCPDCKVPMVIR